MIISRYTIVYMHNINNNDIQRLAELSRLSISDDDSATLQKDLLGILDYVGSIQELDIPTTDDERRPVANVLRSDDTPHESGVFTKDILDNAPDRDGDYIRVKKVL